MGLFGFFLKLLRLLLKVTKVTTGHQKWPKIGQNSTITFYFARRAKIALGRSPPQELEVGPRSEPYLLVLTNEASPNVRCSPNLLEPPGLSHVGGGGVQPRDPELADKEGVEESLGLVSEASTSSRNLAMSPCPLAMSPGGRGSPPVAKPPEPPGKGTFNRHL